MIYSGFILGFLGSFHCLVMCGPIAMALAGTGNQKWKTIGKRLVYNLGRTFTYIVLGAIVGLIGESITFLWGYQIYISVLLGIFFVAMGVFAQNPENFMMRMPMVSGFFSWIRQELSRHIKNNGWDTHFVIGMLNGFLPCGLVYMALAGALATGFISDSIVYMAFFGLGTIPMMLLLAIAGKWASTSLRSKMKKLYPAIFIMLGLFLVYRGLTIDMKANPSSETGVEVLCN